MMPATDDFLTGRQDYRDKKPRPPTPNDDNQLSSEAFRWYGWMVERAVDINKIFEEIRQISDFEFKPADTFTTALVDQICKRLIRSLDIEHGLSPNRDLLE